MLFYLGPSAVVIAAAAFVVIVLMSIFGSGAVLVWLRRVRRALGRRRRERGDRRA